MVQKQNEMIEKLFEKIEKQGSDTGREINFI